MDKVANKRFRLLKIGTATQTVPSINSWLSVPTCLSEFFPKLSPVIFRKSVYSQFFALNLNCQSNWEVVLWEADRKNTSFSFLGERMEKNEKLGYQLIGSRKFTKSIAATGTIARLRCSSFYLRNFFLKHASSGTKLC